MTESFLLALHTCVTALVAEVRVLDPGWAPVEPPPWPPQRDSLAPAPDYHSGRAVEREQDTLPPGPELPSTLPDPEACSCDESVALRAQLVHMSGLLRDAEDRCAEQQGYTLRNAEHWEKAEAELVALTDKQYKAVALLIDANLRGDKLEARLKLWRQIAHIKHRLISTLGYRRLGARDRA